MSQQCYMNGDYNPAFEAFPGNSTIENVDPEMAELLYREKRRQFGGIELIASENFTSRAVMQALGSCATNKYSEGYPGARYYGGNEVIDEIESLVVKRCLETFRLNDAEWGVNVQPYSGSSANFELYTAILAPHERIMGLDLPSGGHLTHGFYTAKKKVSATSIYFESLPYKIHPETGLIDYDQLEEQALLFRPKLLISGASAYPREFDFERLRQIADKAGAYLLCDMAHISGLVAAAEVRNCPFKYCDFVTSTTHKTLRGPRQGLIFYRKGPMLQYSNGIMVPVPNESYDFESKIKMAVFPGCQGGPHNNTIAALGVALKEANTPEFKAYIKQVKANANALAEELVSMGYKLVTGGTENHLVLWDLRPTGISGNKMEKVCDAVQVTLNKNSVPGDTAAFNPGGVRIGASAMTSRLMKEDDFKQIARFMDRLVKAAQAIQDKSGPKLPDFIKALEEDQEIPKIKQEVFDFVKNFPMPGGTM